MMIKNYVVAASIFNHCKQTCRISTLQLVVFHLATAVEQGEIALNLIIV